MQSGPAPLNSKSRFGAWGELPMQLIASTCKKASTRGADSKPSQVLTVHLSSNPARASQLEPAQSKNSGVPDIYHNSEYLFCLPSPAVTERITACLHTPGLRLAFRVPNPSFVVLTVDSNSPPPIDTQAGDEGPIRCQWQVLRAYDGIAFV